MPREITPPQLSKDDFDKEINELKKIQNTFLQNATAAEDQASDDAKKILKNNYQINIDNIQNANTDEEKVKQLEDAKNKLQTMSENDKLTIGLKLFCTTATRIISENRIKTLDDLQTQNKTVDNPTPDMMKTLFSVGSGINLMKKNENETDLNQRNLNNINSKRDYSDSLEERYPQNPLHAELKGLHAKFKDGKSSEIMMKPSFVKTQLKSK